MRASIPSPVNAAIHLGPLTLRAYALCILAGIVAAVWITQRRLLDRGGRPGQALDVAMYAVPFGIVGGRIYHVVTTPSPYFGEGGHPVDALKIWNGGLGIWGGVAFGALGAYLMGRRRGVRFPALLDALAPALLVAQAIGRLGNWFNSELFGRPSTLPWALEIAPEYRPAGYGGFDTFHPTFLYELLWNLAVAVVLVVLDRRFRLGHGKVFALYVLLYSAGRFWIEALRIDSVNEIGGFRLNNYTSALTFLAAAAVLVWLHRNRPGREQVVEAGRPGSRDAAVADQSDAPTAASVGGGTTTVTTTVGAADSSADAGDSGAAGGSATMVDAAEPAGAAELTPSASEEQQPPEPARVSTPGKGDGAGGGVG